MYKPRDIAHLLLVNNQPNESFLVTNKEIPPLRSYRCSHYGVICSEAARSKSLAVFGSAREHEYEGKPLLSCGVLTKSSIKMEVSSVMPKRASGENAGADPSTTGELTDIAPKGTTERGG